MCVFGVGRIIHLKAIGFYMTSFSIWLQFVFFFFCFFFLCLCCLLSLFVPHLSSFRYLVGGGGGGEGGRGCVLWLFLRIFKIK